MYIAHYRVNGTNHYFIKESYAKDGTYFSRDIMDLGHDPGVFIRYPNNSGFYVDDVVEDSLYKKGMTVSFDELENMFWPYVRRDIQYRFGYARSRSRAKAKKKIDAGRFHMFDKRRLHFLKFGQMDQSRIYRTRSTLFQVLGEKSRDELEQYFMLKEKILKPKEFKSYVYVIFDLQRHFGKTFSREMPQVLDQDEVDERFLEGICRLNRDSAFWAGMDMEFSLQAYLRRYMIMFFDSSYPQTRFFDDKLYDWMNSRRTYRPFPFKSKEALFEEASTVFGKSSSELQKMTKRELTKLYRMKASELHPDKEGGSHDKFVALSTMFDELVSKVKG